MAARCLNRRRKISFVQSTSQCPFLLFHVHNLFYQRDKVGGIPLVSAPLFPRLLPSYCKPALNFKSNSPYCCPYWLVSIRLPDCAILLASPCLPSFHSGVSCHSELVIGLLRSTSSTRWKELLTLKLLWSLSLIYFYH